MVKLHKHGGEGMGWDHHKLRAEEEGKKERFSEKGWF